MTLGFTTHFPDGSPTLFEQKILLPYEKQIEYHYPDLLPKIHTFRLGHRWRAGMKIHMVTGNRTPQRHQFNTNIPELQTCISVQEAVIHRQSSGIRIGIGGSKFFAHISPQELLLFAANDGFNSIDEMERWFFPKGQRSKAKILEGQIVHWTDFRYTPQPSPRDDWYSDPGRAGYVDF